MTFKWLGITGTGHNYGKPKRKRDQNIEPYRLDKNGVPIPTQVRRYPYADEYTYRI